MSYKLAQLTVNPKQKSSVASKIFVSQPSAEEELLVGRLFVLMEIDASRADDFTVADFIVKEIYHNYYENEKFFLRDKISNLKIDYIFEAALTKLNRSVADFIENEKMRLKPGSLNLIIGVIHKNKLLFAHAGTNKALLFYRPKNKAGEILSDYNIVDITEKTEDPTQELANPNKFFSNVTGGAIPVGGYFCFANESLLEYLSKKQLCEIVTTLPPAGAAEQIKNLLDATNAFVPFFALIIKNTTGEEHQLMNYPATSGIGEPIPQATGSGQSSVRKFNLTQEKTEQLLSPSGLVNIKKWMNKLKPSADIKAYASDKARQLSITGDRLNARRQKMQLGRKVVDTIRVVAGLVADGAVSVFRFASNPESRQQVVASSRSKAQSFVNLAFNLTSRFKALPRKHKILLSVIGACLLILIGNVAYSGIVKQRQAEAARLEQVKTSFQQKENQLEANLLYENETGSKETLSEMEALLAGLTDKSEEEIALRDELTQRYHARIDKLYNITRVTNPAAYFELPAESDSLLTDGEYVFAASSAAKTVYRIGADKSMRETAFANFSGSPIVSSSLEEGVIYYWDGGLVVHVPESNSFVQSTIDNPGEITAAAIYNDRLYTVDAASGEIYRFNQNKTDRSFNGRIAWLRDEATFSSVSGISIDGRIHLIDNKQVKRFSGGTADTITLETISPALEEPTQVIASENQDFVYVLEPKNKRVIAYNDNGKYLAQYASESFGALKGMTVDEGAKKLYLLNGKTIYQVDMKHL